MSRISRESHATFACDQRAFSEPAFRQIREQPKDKNRLNKTKRDPGYDPTVGSRNETTLPGGKRSSLIFQRFNSRQSYRGERGPTISGGKLEAGSPCKMRTAIRADSIPSCSA